MESVSRISLATFRIRSRNPHSHPPHSPRRWIDTRRGTLVGDDAIISNKDSKESGGEMQMLEATETTLYKQNTSLVRPSMRPRDLKLNKEQRHDKLGHFGSHRNCIHCQQVKQRPRRVYKNPTPVYDHIPSLGSKGQFQKPSFTSYTLTTLASRRYSKSVAASGSWFPMSRTVSFLHLRSTTNR